MLQIVIDKLEALKLDYSRFTPNNPQDLGLNVGDSINYRGGRPDFSPWAKTPWSSSGKGPKGFKVTGMTGDPDKDFTRMRRALTYIIQVEIRRK